MAIETKTDANGNFETRATGKDVAALRGTFRELAAADREKRLAEHKENPSRRLKNRGGAIVEVPGRSVDACVSRGFAIADARPGTVMPANFQGFDALGRVVYDRPLGPGEWEPSTTKAGVEGFSLKG